MRKVCILGVDPGTTTGYAVLDIDGNLIRLKSARDLSVERLLQEVIDAGKIAIVGVDVKYSPRYVKRICRILGARLISPLEDIKEGFKDRITENFRVKDDHQRDALASALLAYNEVKAMFRKVDNRLKERGKEHVSDDVKLLVLKGLSVDDALFRLEEKEIIPQKKKRIRSPPKATKISEEKEFLQQELKVTKEKYGMLRRRFLDSKERIHEIVDVKLRKNLEVHKHSMQSAVTQVHQMQKEIASLKQDVERLRAAAVQGSGKTVIKKFPTLEFNNFKEGIMIGECILVEDPAKWNEKGLGYLEKQEACIISMHPIQNILKSYSVTWLNLENLPHEEVQDLIIINSNDLKKERENKELLGSIIEEYKKKRSSN